MRIGVFALSALVTVALVLLVFGPRSLETDRVASISISLPTSDDTGLLRAVGDGQIPRDETVPFSDPGSLSGPPPGEMAFREFSRYLELDDPENAIKSLRQAAGMGHPVAAFNLAQFLRVGTYGVAEDWSEAKFWYEQAGKGGLSEAYLNQGLLIIDSKGKIGTPQEALDALRISAALGNERARPIVEQVEARIAQ